jgi:hypothetical protein
MLGLAGAVTYEFGSKVALGDSDVGNLLYNTEPVFRYWDLGPAVMIREISSICI